MRSDPRPIPAQGHWLRERSAGRFNLTDDGLGRIAPINLTGQAYCAHRLADTQNMSAGLDRSLCRRADFNAAAVFHRAEANE
jgi:hypothetical protein